MSAPVADDDDVDILGRPGAQPQTQLDRDSALQEEVVPVVTDPLERAEQHHRADPSTQPVAGDALLDA
jgi:hypothetical protein